MKGILAGALERRLEEHRERGRQLAQGPGLSSERIYHQIMENYYEGVVQAQGEGKPLASSVFCLPTELYAALGVTPFFPDHFSINSVSQDLQEYCALGEGFGLSSESCFFHRLGVGLARAEVSPRPACVVFTGFFCDGNEQLYSLMGELFQRPTFLVDAAYGSGEGAVAYLKGELEGLARFLEETTGRRLDRDGLEEAIRQSKRAWTAWYQIGTLARSIPCPTHTADNFAAYEVMMLAAGHPLAADYMEARLGELREKVARGEGIVPRERHRIAWWSGYPFFDMTILDWLEQEYGAVVAADLYNPLVTGPERPEEVLETAEPFEYLARKTLNFGSVKICGFYSESLGRQVVRATRELQADCAIYYVSFGCQTTSGLARIIKDQMAREVGIPTLILDGDFGDPRIVSSAQLRSKLREFFSMLEGNSSAR